MQVDDGVDLVLGAQINHAVEVLEARLLDNSWVQVVLEVPIVDLASVVTSLRLTGMRIQFKPKLEKSFASSSVKKYSRNWT